MKFLHHPGMRTGRGRARGARGCGGRGHANGSISVGARQKNKLIRGNWTNKKPKIFCRLQPVSEEKAW